MTVAASRERRWFGSTEVLVVALILMALAASRLRGIVDANEKLATAGTVFCGVFVQAVPFLALGVIVSGLVATFVTPERLARWLPNRSVAAVAVAGVSGAALPGCECGSVPVARRLYGPGSVGAAALTFMLSAPAINPVVLVATAVAFPGQPKIVLARAVASLLTAIIMGMVWSRWGRDSWVTRKLPTAHAGSGSRWTTFTEAARHDFLQAASYLAIGAVAAAALHVLVPAWVFEHLAGNLVVGVVTMALLAVVLALCSEADAFVAAWLPGTEGAGVADVLIGDAAGKPRNDFTGTLSFSWPKTAKGEPLNVGQPGYDPQFAYGYGLTYARNARVGALSEDSGVVGSGSNLDRYFVDGRFVAPWSLMLRDAGGDGDRLR